MRLSGLPGGRCPRHQDVRAALADCPVLLGKGLGDLDPPARSLAYAGQLQPVAGRRRLAAAAGSAGRRPAS
jgi:hypothetical protein